MRVREVYETVKWAGGGALTALITMSHLIIPRRFHRNKDHANQAQHVRRDTVRHWRAALRGEDPN